MQEEDILQHFGILGMKWGHRKGRTEKPKKKKLRDMTNQELMERNQRMQLERTYKSLGRSKAAQDLAGRLAQDFFLSVASQGAASYISKHGKADSPRTKLAMDFAASLGKNSAAGFAGKFAASYLFDK